MFDAFTVAANEEFVEIPFDFSASFIGEEFEKWVGFVADNFGFGELVKGGVVFECAELVDFFVWLWSLMAELVAREV